MLIADRYDVPQHDMLTVIARTDKFWLVVRAAHATFAAGVSLNFVH